MDSKGSSLPSMPEPANPTSMKQPPESPSVRKGGGDVSGEPALLIMDKAAAQLAATLQDGVLQKMAGHGHNNQSLERLKDLTSRVLNGDQDAPPKLCAPEGADAPATNGTRQRNCSPRAEPKAASHQAVEQPSFEPSCANGTGPSAAAEDEASAPEKRRDPKKRRGASRKATLGPAAPLGEPGDRADAVDGTGAADEVLGF